MKRAGVSAETPGSAAQRPPLASPAGDERRWSEPPPVLRPPSFVLPPSDEGGGKPGGFDGGRDMVNPHGEPPSAYWLQILSLSRLRRQLPRQREPRGRGNYGSARPPTPLASPAGDGDAAYPAQKIGFSAILPRTRVRGAFVLRKWKGDCCAASFAQQSLLISAFC